MLNKWVRKSPLHQQLKLKDNLKWEMCQGFLYILIKYFRIPNVIVYNCSGHFPIFLNFPIIMIKISRHFNTTFSWRSSTFQTICETNQTMADGLSPVTPSQFGIVTDPGRKNQECLVALWMCFRASLGDR